MSVNNNVLLDTFLESLLPSTTENHISY